MSNSPAQVNTMGLEPFESYIILLGGMPVEFIGNYFVTNSLHTLPVFVKCKCPNGYSVHKDGTSHSLEYPFIACFLGLVFFNAMYVSPRPPHK